MRRGSVIGPLILIVIGALFLMRNLWPDIPLADLISRYWPFVLIAWGGLRLLEIMFAAAMSKPIPRNGISGGEWMLVFLIFFAIKAAKILFRGNEDGVEHSRARQPTRR